MDIEIVEYGLHCKAVILIIDRASISDTASLMLVDKEVEFL